MGAGQCLWPQKLYVRSFSALALRVSTSQRDSHARFTRGLAARVGCGGAPVPFASFRVYWIPAQGRDDDRVWCDALKSRLLQPIQTSRGTAASVPEIIIRSLHEPAQARTAFHFDFLGMQI